MESIVLGIYLCFKMYFLIDTNAKMWTEITDLVVLGRNYWNSCRVSRLKNSEKVQYTKSFPATTNPDSQLIHLSQRCSFLVFPVHSEAINLSNPASLIPVCFNDLERDRQISLNMLKFEFFYSLYKVGRNGSFGIKGFNKIKKKLLPVGFDLIYEIITGFKSPMSPKSETFRSSYSHVLLILTKSSQVQKPSGAWT